jgi:hypothetical protein
MVNGNKEWRLLAGRCALALLIVGLALSLLVPAVGLQTASDSEVVSLHATLGLIAQFLALPFGFLGRRHASGRIAMIGALAVLAFVFAFPLIRR